MTFYRKLVQKENVIKIGVSLIIFYHGKLKWPSQSELYLPVKVFILQTIGQQNLILKCFFSTENQGSDSEVRILNLGDKYERCI